jgi:hypothetical protein
MDDSPGDEGTGVVEDMVGCRVCGDGVFEKCVSWVVSVVSMQVSSRCLMGKSKRRSKR